MTNILDEINDLRSDPTHRAALRIFQLLENNREKFLKKLDPEFFQSIITGFESLAYESPANAVLAEFKERYSRLHQMFEYQVNRSL